jgi:hypothetical protein
MDGSLDDPLARMHRWEALRQKLAVRRGTRLEPVVEEVVEALTELVRRRGVTVTVIVEDAQAQAGVRLAGQDGRVAVGRIDPSEPAEAGPDAGDHAGNHGPDQAGNHGGTRAGGAPPSSDTAARLAELIRRDPWLLDDRDRWDRG